MSRSRRHTPILGNAVARSDKPGKVIAHRALRAAVRSAGIDPDMPEPALREVSDVWDWPKDGKTYQRDPKPAWMRK